MINFKNVINYILGIFQQKEKKKIIPEIILTKIEKLYILKERAIKTWQKEIDNEKIKKI
jgi:hypothetical protein